MPPTVLIVVPDLMFQPRIRDAALSLGLDARVVDDGASAAEAIAAGPAAVIIDLHAARIDTLATIAAAKTQGARVLAFGRHTSPALLRSARAAGADAVVPRSQLVEEIAELLTALATKNQEPTT